MPSLSCFAHVQIGSQVSLVTSYQPPGPSPGSFRCQTLHPTQSDLGSQKSYNSFLTHHRPFSFHFPLLTSALIRAHRILPPFFIHNHGGSCRVNTKQGLPHPLDRREQPSPCSRDSQTHLAKPLASRAPPPDPATDALSLLLEQGREAPRMAPTIFGVLESWTGGGQQRTDGGMIMQSPQWPAMVTPFGGFEHLVSPGSMGRSAQGSAAWSQQCSES